MFDMRTRKVLTIILFLSVTLSLASFRGGQYFPSIHPAAAPAVNFPIDLDASSTGQTDTTVTASASQGSTFRVGAVISGSNPAIGTPLLFSPYIKFVNSSDIDTWANGKAVINDTNNNGIYDDGIQARIAGTINPPAPNVKLMVDPKVKFIDANGDGAWQFPEIVVYDTGGTGLFAANDKLIAPSVYGWQFAINYDPTVLIPQANPDPSSAYPDGAGNTVLLGSGTSLCPVYGGTNFGGCNWNAAAAANQGSSFVSTLVPGKILVGFTFLPPHNATFINTKALLANVAFEIIRKPASPITLTVSDIIFIDVDSQQTISTVVAGASASETITNDPPHANITATKISAYVYSFSGTGSTDSDGTIADPAGYYWDFGDGTQDLATTGATILTHDYNSTCDTGCPNGAAFGGLFTVTLRVVDDGGATGSARDSNGSPIVNAQPSHTSLEIVVSKGPTVILSSSPSTPSPGDTVNFDGSSTTDDVAIASYSWDFGDNSPLVTGATATHAYSNPGTFTANLTVTDSLGQAKSMTKLIIVDAQPALTVTGPSTALTSQIVTLSLASSTSFPGGSISTIKIDWGDGKTDNLSGGSTSATHIYTTAGTYTVTVTSTNNNGKSTVKTLSMTVSAPASGLDLTLIAEIAIPIAAVVAAALVLMRRRKKPTAQPK